MKMHDYIPSELLKPFIKDYKIIESRHELVNRVLPNTSVAIAFRFRGQVNYIMDEKANALPVSAISGLRKSVRLINYLKDTGVVIVLFKEAGASAFFKRPLHELFEESLPLHNLIERQKVSMIEEQITAAQNNRERIDIIEQILLSQLYTYKPDNLISTAIKEIRAVNGIVNIKELTGTLYISQDAFEKRFRRIVGSSPKQFASIIRMSSVIQQKANERLLDIAFDAGYYDQAHFTKSFKTFTGQSPTDFYKSAFVW